MTLYGNFRKCDTRFYRAVQGFSNGHSKEITAKYISGFTVLAEEFRLLANSENELSVG